MNYEHHGASSKIEVLTFPTIDLHAVVAGLADSIRPNAQSESQPLFRMNQFMLTIDTQVVMSRLMQSTSFDRLKHFVQNFEPPKTFEQVWIGGRIVENSEEKLKKAIEQLSHAIDQELNNLNSDFSKLLVQELEQKLQQSAKNLGVKRDIFKHNQITVTETQLTPDFLNYESNTLARLFSAIETVHGNKYDNLNNLLKVIRKILPHENVLEDEIDDICSTIETSYKSERSNQLNRFLDFLDQDALSRLRLLVSFEIMSAIAEELKEKEDAKPLVQYIQIAHALFKESSNPDSPELSVDLSGYLGIESFSLNEEWSKTLFYTCLPIWMNSDTQLFENREEHDERGQNKIVREVSYRFRINGKNPEEGRSAYEARLDKIDAVLLGQQSTTAYPYQKKRCLAELIFLAVVLIEKPFETHTLDEQIKTIIKHLTDRPIEYLRKSIDELKKRVRGVDNISKSLVSHLRTLNKRLTQHHFSTPRNYTLNIKKNLINTSRLSCGAEDFLEVESSSKGREKAGFFKFIEITSGAISEEKLRYNLFSIQVTVQLSERSLLKISDSPKVYSVSRQLPKQLVQVLWQPSSDAELEHARGFRLVPRIKLQYSYESLAPERDVQERNSQLLAASQTAFTILCYVVLERVLARIPSPDGHRLTVTSLRIQEQGKEESPDTENDISEADQKTIAIEIIYAVSQAIEMVLGQGYHFKVQGFSVKDDKSLKYRKYNTFAALYSLFPLMISAPETSALNKVGIITFATRPCDGTVQAESNEHQGHILLAHTYVLEKTPQGYLIQHAGHRTQIGFGHDMFEQPSLIPEEIKRLAQLDCQHILYMSHRFKTRRIRRSDMQDRLHDHPNFLNALYESFPDILLYPIVRDVFPVFRLSERKKQTIEIEGSQFKIPPGFKLLYADYIPVYALGTLHIVGDEMERPQSGICTYFLLNDQRKIDQERSLRVAKNLCLPESPIRADLIMALRLIHFLEAEKIPIEDQLVPVLDPYVWMHPTTIQGMGEINSLTLGKQHKKVVLSLTAVLTRISDVLHSLKS